MYFTIKDWVENLIGASYHNTLFLDFY